MRLHREIIDHLERLEVPVPEALDGSAIEMLTAVRWPATRFATCFDLWRETIVDSGVDEAEDWQDFEVLEFCNYQPLPSVGLQFGTSILLDLYSGTDPQVSTCWAQDSAHIFFLEENASDPSNPIVTALDHELVDERPMGNGTVSEFLAVLEPEG